MSNQNLVPRAHQSGSIGIPSKQWGHGSFVDMDVTNMNITNAAATGSFTGSLTGSGTGEFNGTFNGDFIGDGSGLTGVIAVATGSIIGIQRIFDSGSQVEEYSSISGALSDSTDGDTVFVGAGTYEESDIVIPKGVQLIGKTATARDVILQGSDVSNFVVKILDDSQIAHFEVVGGNNENPIVILQGEDTVGKHPYMQDISIRAGNNPNQPGVSVSGSGFVFIENTKFITTGDVLGDSILFTGNENLSLFAKNLSFSAVARSVLKTTGSAGVIEINGIEVEGTATDYTYGFDIDSDVSLQAMGLNWSGDVSSSVYFNENSDGANVQVFSSNVEGDENDVLIHPSASGVGTRASFGSVSFRTERYNDQSMGTFSTNAEIDGMFIDRGIVEEPKTVVLGDFSVGTPIFGSESSFGEGASTVNDLIVISSGSTGFVDNTVDALSTGSIFEVFPEDSGSGATFYIGNPRRKFSGLRTTVSAPQINGDVAGVWEYSSGSEWVEFTIMHTDGEFPYNQWAQKPWPSASNAVIQNTRFDALLVEDLENQPVDWTTTTVNGEEGYFVRYRLTADLSQSAEVRQLALHTNRSQFAKDGFYEQFGQGQMLRSLPWHKKNEYSVVGSSPGNQNIELSTNIELDGVDNRFNNGVVDANAGTVRVPAGLDTSRKLQFTVNFFGLNNADSAGEQVELRVRTLQLQKGINVNNSSVPEVESEPKTIPISQTDAGILKSATFNIDIADLKVGETFVIQYYRDASGSNPNDTYDEPIVILSIDLLGYFWN